MASRKDVPKTLKVVPADYISKDNVLGAPDDRILATKISPPTKELNL